MNAFFVRHHPDYYHHHAAPCCCTTTNLRPQRTNLQTALKRALQSSQLWPNLEKNDENWAEEGHRPEKKKEVKKGRGDEDGVSDRGCE